MTTIFRKFFCLLKDKSTEIYELYLPKVKDLCNTVNLYCPPKEIVFHFEMFIHVAVVIIMGCDMISTNLKITFNRTL